MFIKKYFFILIIPKLQSKLFKVSKTIKNYFDHSIRSSDLLFFCYITQFKLLKILSYCGGLTIKLLSI